jgi:hypothetical protein
VRRSFGAKASLKYDIAKTENIEVQYRSKCCYVLKMMKPDRRNLQFFD